MKKRSDIIKDYIIAKINFDIISNPSSIYAVNDDPRIADLKSFEINEEIFMPAFEKIYQINKDYYPIGFAYNLNTLILLTVKLDDMSLHTMAYLRDNDNYFNYLKECAKLSSNCDVIH